MNARLDLPSVDKLNAAAASGTPLKIVGAWRFWTEHGGDSTHRQGSRLEPFDTTNPDHVFEIHPIISIDGVSTAGTLQPIEGYQAKDAHNAFVRYENMRSQISLNASAKTTTITTTMAGYNYVEFVMEITDDTQHVVDDGRFVFANVRDTAGELLVQKKRMIFSLRIPDWKHFLRLRIDATGALTIFPIGIQQVPRHWDRRATGAGGSSVAPAQGHGIAPRLIEDPIVVGRNQGPGRVGTGSGARASR